MSRTVLILGATGKVSGEVIKALRGSPLKLRALVRDRAKVTQLEQSNVEWVEGTLDEPESLGAAFHDVDDLWLLTPPGPRAPEQSMNALWAAKRSGVRRVVRMSAIGAAYDAPTRNGRLHALSDAELQSSELRWTIVRPHFFMQNLLGFAPGIAQDGRFYIDLGGGRMGLVDVRDIGEFVARVLLDDPERHHGKIYTLTGPQSITMNDAAAELSKVLEKPVEYVPVPHDVSRRKLIEIGLSPWLAGLTTEYSRAYSRGWGDLTTSHFQDVAGKPARSLETFVREVWPR